MSDKTRPDRLPPEVAQATACTALLHAAERVLAVYGEEDKEGQALLDLAVAVDQLRRSYERKVPLVLLYGLSQSDVSSLLAALPVVLVLIVLHFLKRRP